MFTRRRDLKIKIKELQDELLKVLDENETKENELKDRLKLAEEYGVFSFSEFRYYGNAIPRIRVKEKTFIKRVNRAFKIVLLRELLSFFHKEKEQAFDDEKIDKVVKAITEIGE